MSTKKRVTLKMIAEKVGTSVGTVDRAINNRPGISGEIKKNILQAAETLGYRPNKVASALGRQKTIRLGIVFPETPWEFYESIDAGIEKAKEELQDYGVEIEKIRYQSQLPSYSREILSKIELERFDGFAVNAAGVGASIEIDRFITAGVPTITFNTDCPESRRIFFIGNNSRVSGYVGAELLITFLGGKGNVITLGNFAMTTPFLERFGGFSEYLQENPSEIKLYPPAECFSEPGLAKQRLKELICQTENEIHGVFCTGYSSTVGAIQAMEELGREDIVVVGYDLTATTAEALKKGVLNALLYQEQFEQGYLAAKLLARYILEGWVPDRQRIHVDTHIVLKSNVQSFLDRAFYKY